MQYGYFDNDKREYVITNPETPLPWINYLGADRFCGLISQSAGGYCFYEDALLRRILRYRYNNIPMDMGGRYLYLRDNKTEDFWSLTWQPVRPAIGEYKYECRHGMGYTRISSEYKGISTSTLYFVPKNEINEVWCCEVTNNTDVQRELSMFSFVEFCLIEAQKDMTDFQFNLNIGTTKVKDSVIYHDTLYGTDAIDIFAYFACNRELAGFDTQRRDFLGTYGSLEKPRAVVENKCRNSIARGWSPVGSHHIVLTLKPGETQKVVFVLGAAHNFGDELPIVEKYKDEKAVDVEMQKLKEYWDRNLSAYATSTPDEEINTMVNIWNQYQCRTTFNWSRSASYYESGIGRGMGFRDSCQDIVGFVHMIPHEARERLIDIASTQFETGDAYHQYQPLTKKGADGGFSDDHLWLILATAQYIKESGDLDILKVDTPYNCGEGGKSGTLYNHLDKALEFTVTHCGPEGLPLMLRADWNDCLNLNGAHKRAESVFTALQFIYVAKEMVQLADMMGDSEGKKKYQKYADDMIKNVNEYAWDGEWFKRGFTEEGRPVGSHVCDEGGQIYLLPQAWAVMAGASDRERLVTAMNSLNKRLASEHGIHLFLPGYEVYDWKLGAVSLYPAGLKENAGIFCHPNPWAIIAETILGRGDLAYQYHKALLPAAKNEISEVRKTEPYVYCQMIAGKDHTEFGEGKNSWLTGTAAWSFFAVSSYILGVRAGYDGLVVDPCIPKDWESLQVNRRFRGAEYSIKIFNPDKVNKGIKCIKVDGKEIEGNVLPYNKDKLKYDVEVYMG